MVKRKKVQKKKNEIDLTKKPKISLIKYTVNKKKAKNRRVEWDWQSLAKQEKERLENPKMKIDEPKTPFEPYEGNDNDYLNKVNKILNIKSTDEIITKAIDTLNKCSRKDSSSSYSDEYVEVEVMEPNGERKMEKVKTDHKDSKEFLEKRKEAYANEFIQAKMKYNEDKDESSSEDSGDDEVMKQTLKNTLINKFSGKLNDSQIEEIMEKEIKDKK